MSEEADNTQHVFIGPFKALRDPNLKAPVFRTLCEIWIYCWNDDRAKWTEPTTTPSLAKALDMERTTLWRHLKELKNRGYIEVEILSDAVYTLRPIIDNSPNLLQTRDVRCKSAPITSLTTINTESINDIKTDVLVVKEKEGAKNGDGCNLATTRENLSPPTPNASSSELLRRAGVSDPMKTRLACKSHVNPRMVLAHVVHGMNNNDPISHVITRIRDDIPPPSVCSMCYGTDGKHNKVQVTWPDAEPDRDDCPKPFNMPPGDVEELFGKDYKFVIPIPEIIKIIKDIAITEATT